MVAVSINSIPTCQTSDDPPKGGEFRGGHTDRSTYMRHPLGIQPLPPTLIPRATVGGVWKAGMMTTSGSGLTPDMVGQLLNEGWTGQQIADRYGVTKGRVSQLKKEYKGDVPATPRQVAMRSYPWKTTEEDNATWVDVNLRNHVEYVATGGKGMKGYKRYRLRQFYLFLLENDYVVGYDPNLVPVKPSKQGVDQLHRRHDASQPVGRYRFYKRVADDGDLMIRVDEHTTLTDDGRIVWRIPPQLPEVDE